MELFEIRGSAPWRTQNVPISAAYPILRIVDSVASQCLAYPFLRAQQARFPLTAYPFLRISVATISRKLVLLSIIHKLLTESEYLHSRIINKLKAFRWRTRFCVLLVVRGWWRAPAARDDLTGAYPFLRRKEHRRRVWGVPISAGEHGFPRRGKELAWRQVTRGLCARGATASRCPKAALRTRFCATGALALVIGLAQKMRGRTRFCVAALHHRAACGEVFAQPWGRGGQIWRRAYPFLRDDLLRHSRQTPLSCRREAPE